MSRLYITRRPKRKGLLIQRLGNKSQPNLLFPLEGVDKSELDELVRAILAKGGVTEETEIQAIVERAEQDSEVRIKVSETRAELRRLMSLRAKGARLIQVGFRKWKEAFYPAVHIFSKE